MVPLWKLCFEGKLIEARAALANGEDPNTRTPEWMINEGDGEIENAGPVNATALILAASAGHNDIVKLLLEQPAVDPNCCVFALSFKIFLIITLLAI